MAKCNQLTSLPFKGLTVFHKCFIDIYIHMSMLMVVFLAKYFSRHLSGYIWVG